MKVKVWAIVGERGNGPYIAFLPRSPLPGVGTKVGLISLFVYWWNKYCDENDGSKTNWRQLKRRGYRCVRATVTWEDGR